jgi:hypothetical protein
LKARTRNGKAGDGAKIRGDVKRKEAATKEGERLGERKEVEDCLEVSSGSVERDADGEGGSVSAAGEEEGESFCSRLTTFVSIQHLSGTVDNVPQDRL